jgi:hypothetical protein
MKKHRTPINGAEVAASKPARTLTILFNGRDEVMDIKQEGKELSIHMLPPFLSNLAVTLAYTSGYTKGKLESQKSGLIVAPANALKGAKQ